MNHPTSSGKSFGILALDSGGTRGIYIGQILARVESDLKKPIKDCFDLIVRTNIGSIIVGAVVAIPMAKIVGLFEDESARIFRSKGFVTHLSMRFRSKHSRAPLEEMLGRYVPQLTLGEVTTPLMITSSDISTCEVHVFKSAYLRELGEPYERNGEVLLRDAVLASCAAPMYFDPKSIGPYLLADGGLWADNPSIIALTEALSAFKKPVERVRVLSIGTGYTKNT